MHLVVAGSASTVVLAACLTAAATVAAPVQPERQDAPTARAVSYLVREVPRWRREHPCYSCHNNGDAARALISASRAGHDIGTALDDTMAWLRAPERWEHDARRGGSEDLPLGRVHFGAALAAMARTGQANQTAVNRASELLLRDQHPDGAWRVNAAQILGGPTAYGATLATAMAVNVLRGSSLSTAQAALVRAERFLRRLEVVTVLDASSVLVGLGDGAEDAAARDKALQILQQGQAPDGGWGPYVTSPPDAFDTALAVLALVRSGSSNGSAPTAAIARGRQYLVTTQESDGSWVETTRPPGGESYAQRVSTTAWALLALLESAEM